MNTGLYIHIPFCVKKCNYCDFYSLGCPSKGNMERYISALCTHIKREAPLYKSRVFDTVFLGGGTPSVLPPELTKTLLTCLKSSLNISPNAEISVEVNPGTVTEEIARVYKENGVNRVSIGLQSVNDSELKMLGRIHTLSEFKESYRILRDMGIDNINIDIMYALPDQKTEDFIKTLDQVVEFKPEHISAYCLKIEENTPFYKMRDSLILPNEDEQYKMYLTLCEALEKSGYEQYEISNFSKKGHRCVHNLKYWLSKEYVAFGPSAHSYIDGVRYSYKDSINEYIEAVEGGSLPIKELESTSELTREEKMDEYVMLCMRLSDGVSIEEFEARFGESFKNRYKKLEMYVKNGYVTEKNGTFAFTPKGFFVSNYILSDILENI
ncbi:MAG: radical SAM family heme chaperone HemW [Clostridia bacterium]|nr:radical SAM family heme chaperone HemW [Clostridia bacterium]